MILHDCHAEILAIRAFNFWLLTECRSLLAQEERAGRSPSEASSNSTSSFLRRRYSSSGNNASLPISNGSSSSWQRFELHPDIKIYMYCTCAPCGDASMELCMAAQEDATPWDIRDTDDPEKQPALLDGRAYFSRLGVVRRKPCRADADATRSKSCSDKLALRQVSSLLSHETSLLVAPTQNTYLAGLILPDIEISRSGCERSFGKSGRMKPLNELAWPEYDEQEYGYRFQPFEILTIPIDQFNALWAYGKPTSQPASPSSPPPEDNAPKKSRPSNQSVIWTLAPSHSSPMTAGKGTRVLPILCDSRTGLFESIVNGVRQGHRASLVGPRGASALSRARLWGLLRDTLLQELDGNDNQARRKSSVGSECHHPHPANELLQLVLEATTYSELKDISLSNYPFQARGEAIRTAKGVLKDWIPNSGDESWGLEVLDDPKPKPKR